MSYSDFNFCGIQILEKSLPSVLGFLGKDCNNIVNNTSCLTTTSFITRVVVGGRKESLVSSIQIQEPQHRELDLKVYISFTLH